MKKLVIFFLTIIFLCGIAPSAFAGLAADLVSFSDSLMNVDGDTSSWSSDTTALNAENLGISVWSILGGQGQVTANGGNLSHRLGRGLGIWGGENDEIDGSEWMAVDFEMPYWVESIELRSLFDKDGGAWELGADERGRIDFYNNGLLLASQEVIGDQGEGTNGLKTLDFADPYAVDKLIFFVPHIVQGNSEFALSKMRVVATPEPLSTVLFLVGAGTLVAVRRRKAKK